ncbi:PC4-domain-containing protein [Byssothecium circinans]|uniref:PC4-domain-containing protein n=1 Tax=Byssothecium circinans TaxID=147558 RepID=A0A6A5UFN8_9PLEO|nr:PC4-domain-containing protein [Byssothecium circinans]
MAGTHTAKRGGARGGGFKKASYNKKRSSPDDDDTNTTARASKKSKNEEESTPFVPKLEEDDDQNVFVALKANGTRRVMISDFKGKTLVSIREYYEDASGEMKPGKKGIALSMDQYNALVAAMPLIETVLVDKKEDVVRPDYDAPLATADAEEEEEGEEPSESGE